MSNLTKKKVATILHRHGLSFAEWSILEAISYGSRAAHWVGPTAAGASEMLAGPSRKGPEKVLSVADAQEALASCLSRGWVQLVDAHVLDEIQTQLRMHGVVGPIYDLPAIGDIDFTPQGAIVVQQIAREFAKPKPADDFGFSIIFDHGERKYYWSREGALRAIKGFEADQSVASITGPIPVGPWSVHWWEQFPEGYVVEATFHDDPAGAKGTTGSRT